MMTAKPKAERFTTLPTDAGAAAILAQAKRLYEEPSQRPPIDPRTAQGKKALCFLAYPIAVLVELLKLPPYDADRCEFYSRGQLCVMCAEAGVKRSEADRLLLVREARKKAQREAKTPQ